MAQNKRSSEYLLKIIHDYLQDNKIFLQDGQEEHEVVINSGVPQEPVIGPLLWNILYEGSGISNMCGRFVEQAKTKLQLNQKGGECN